MKLFTPRVTFCAVAAAAAIGFVPRVDLAAAPPCCPPAGAAGASTTKTASAHGHTHAGGAAHSAAKPGTVSKPGTAAKSSGKPGAKAPAQSAKKKTPAQLRAEKLDALWKQTDAAFHKGDYPRAVAIHRQIVTIDPTDVESYSNAAWLLWSMGKGNEALAHLQRGVKANPKSADMWEAVGDHMGTFVKRPGEALAAYRKALQYSKPGANTHMMRRRLAHAAERSGDLQTAVTTWRALVRDFPNVAVNQNNLRRVEGMLKSGSAST
jgi:tetratricopeptide (TPR) repeat protein